MTLPNSFFGKFNPYADLIHGDWYSSKGRPNHTGAVYLHGDWLLEAVKLDEVLKPAGKHAALVCRGDAMTRPPIWAQFPGVNPNDSRVEINVRQTVFTPEKTGHQLSHRARLRPAQRRHALGAAHRRADRHRLRLLVQGLDHREQRNQLLEMLRRRAGQIQRRVGQPRRVAPKATSARSPAR